MLIWYLSELQWKIVTTYYRIASLVNRSVYVLRVHFPNIMFYFQTDLLNINHYRAKYSWGKRRHICLFNNLPNLRPVSRPWDLLRSGGKISYTLMNKGPGSRFNKNILSYQYKKSHCGDKTILRPSFLHSGISYTGKMTSLYWIGALVTYTDTKLTKASHVCHTYTIRLVFIYGV